MVEQLFAHWRGFNPVFPGDVDHFHCSCCGRQALGIDGLELSHKIKNRELYSLHLAPDCKSWILLQNLNKCTRTQDRPEGDGTLEHEVRGNCQQQWRFGLRGYAHRVEC